MKKLLPVLLAIAIVFGLCACAGSGSEGGNTEPKLEACAQATAASMSPPASP